MNPGHCGVLYPGFTHAILIQGGLSGGIQSAQTLLLLGLTKPRGHLVRLKLGIEPSVNPCIRVLHKDHFFCMYITSSSCTNLNTLHTCCTTVR
jgi:hypothetical protein